MLHHLFGKTIPSLTGMFYGHPNSHQTLEIARIRVYYGLRTTMSLKILWRRLVWRPVCNQVAYAIMSFAWVILKGKVSCSDRTPGAPRTLPVWGHVHRLSVPRVDAATAIALGLVGGSTDESYPCGFRDLCNNLFRRQQKAQQINRWYIYLHLVDVYGKCRSILTWIPWERGEIRIWQLRGVSVWGWKVCEEGEVNQWIDLPCVCKELSEKMVFSRHSVLHVGVAVGLRIWRGEMIYLMVNIMLETIFRVDDSNGKLHKVGWLQNI